MKIRTLEINQFGSFERRMIQMPNSPFVIIYGENEAGKSTLMNYILSILFGFPQKNECARWSRNCPESRFGGAIQLEFEKQRLIRLERLYSDRKAPIACDSLGRTIAVNSLFSPVDRYLYENVFCFDLEGLRGIERFRPDQLNNLLLGAGMLGNQTIAELEAQLAKATGQLFKKGGKVPEINHLLHELEQADKDLRKWQGRLTDFSTLQENIKADRQSLKEISKRRNELQRLYMNWKTYQRLLPFIESNQALDEELEKMSACPILSDGSEEQFESLCAAMDRLQQELANYQHDLDAVREKMGTLPDQPLWLENEERIHQLSREAIADEQNARALIECAAEKQHLTEEYNQISVQLGNSWTAERIQNAAVDLGFQREAEKRLSEWRQQQAAEDDCHADVNRQEDELQQLQLRIDRPAPSTSISGRNRRVSSSQLTLTRWLIVMCEGTLVVALLAGLIAGMRGSVLVVVTGVFCVTIAALFKGREEAHPAARDQQYDAAQALLADQIRLSKRKLTDLQQREAETSARKQQTAMAMSQWLRAHGYELGDDFEALPAFVRLVRDARKALDHLQGIEQEIVRHQRAHETFSCAVTALAAQLERPGEAAQALEQQLNHVKDADHQRRALQAQLEFYKEKIADNQKQLTHLASQKQEWREQAAVTNDGDFRRLLQQNMHRRELMAKRDRQRLTMCEIAGGESALAALLALAKAADQEDMARSAEQFDSELADLDQQEKLLNERLIQEESRRQSLEADDSYSETRMHYAQLKAKLASKAKKWYVYQTAGWAIHEVKTRYREEKLPKVLEKTGRYLREITGGAYQSLELTDSEGFVACRKDGQRFYASELSRGTAEQIYFALRLALTDMYPAGSERLPIIIDDGFVDFDQRRIDNTYRILSRLSDERQIILFTCHYTDYMRQHPDCVLNLTPEQPQLSLEIQDSE
ncbi:MAG: AAA family ATPase [Sporolactobacillus sp.]